MVEDTHDGTFLAPPPFGSHVRPNAGPLGVGTFTYELSDQSIAVREAANAAMQAIVQRSGLARFMKLTFPSSFTAHPLGGCRMAESADAGVVDHRGEAFGNEGLFCIDSSAIPSALGVNPSLTISAVSERSVAQLIDRAADFGLPAEAGGLRAGRPGRDARPAHPAGAQQLRRGDRRQGPQLRLARSASQPRGRRAQNASSTWSRRASRPAPSTITPTASQRTRATRGRGASEAR